jgi:NAD(P)-dependent dehydrogenase (short-subunit alcohol dehydrogenase family)
MGREVAAHYYERGHPVVLTGKDPVRCGATAAELGQDVVGLGFDLSQPATIAPALSDVGPVSRLVLTSISRDRNPVREYEWTGAIELATMKLVGFVEVIHVLLDRLSEDSSVVLFGGRAKDRPYPGSTTVTSVNGAVASMINTLATELAPIRFNAIHPGIVGDSPEWRDKDLAHVVARTPTKRLTTMQDVVDATVFLLENPAMNGANLYVDGGWMLT